MLMNSVDQELGQGTMGMVFLCSTMSGPPLGRLSGWGLESLGGVIRQMMLVAGWELSWGCPLEYLCVASLGA